MEAVERILRVDAWINIMTNIVIWVDYAVKGFCIHYYFSSFLESRFSGGRFWENRLGREKPVKSLLERKKAREEQVWERENLEKPAWDRDAREKPAWK